MQTGWQTTQTTISIIFPESRRTIAPCSSPTTLIPTLRLRPSDMRTCGIVITPLRRLSTPTGRSFQLFDSKLSSLATYLLTWNKNSFENILAETKSVKNRIKGIQSHPNYHIFTCLQSLKKSLIDDYSEKLNQVETFWA